MTILNLNDQPALIQAIFGGGLEDVRAILSCKPDVNMQDNEKRTPLHAAAFKGDAQIVNMLLQCGAKVNVRDHKWLTPLHRACFTGSEDTAAALIQFQADVTARDRQWHTPLHVAAANQALECVSMLLDTTPTNVNVTDRSGRTAMHHAALNGHIDVIDILLAHGAIVNPCDKKDCRPLHYAAHFGHVDVVELLIKNGADVNAVDRNQYSPLHVAAASGMVSACRVLLNHPSALVNIQNAYGNTPLHLACLNGHLPVCQELLAYRADADAVNYRGQTPLHISAASTHGVLCLNHLLQQRRELGIDINGQSADGRTPLHMTAIHGRFTRSKTLIDNGAVIDTTDKNGCTALHIAAQFGHDTLTNTLIMFGADITKRGFEGRTPLHMSCLSGNIECCRKLLQAGADLNSVDDMGNTPTHCAAYKGSVECLDLLVSKGADFRRPDHCGQTALHIAAAQGHFDCVFTLVGIGSTVHVPDNEGCTPLHLAAAYDTKGKCVEYLLQHKADPHKPDRSGFTAVHYAVAGVNLAGLGFLLAAVGASFSFTKGDLSLTTPLHLAARAGNVDILRQILPHFPDTNVRCAQGRTPLLLAARGGHASCVQMLLRYGAKVALSDTTYNLSPVHYAARNGHVHCLALLVDNTEDVGVINKQDKFERTALMLAVSGGHTDCVVALLKSDADPNIVDADKHSALFRAVVAGQNDIVQFLITKNAEVSKPDINGKTVLHIAAACGHYPCLQTLLKHMTPEEAAILDRQQFSVLHWACYSGSVKCVKHLLDTEQGFNALTGNPFSVVHCAAYVGCVTSLELLLVAFGGDVVRLRDARRRTPLHLACAYGFEYYASCLMQHGAEIDAQDDEGRTPLHAAAHNGHGHLMDTLKGRKADITMYDNNGNTALHIACLRKHSLVALMLLGAIEDIDIINMVNNNRETPLHLSARNGLVDVTRQLIKKGSSVLAVDSNGLTPALCCAPNLNVAQCLSIILASHPGMHMQNGDKGRLSKGEYLPPPPTTTTGCNPITPTLDVLSHPSPSTTPPPRITRPWPTCPTPTPSTHPQLLIPPPPTTCIGCLNTMVVKVAYKKTQTVMSLQRNTQEGINDRFESDLTSCTVLEAQKQALARTRMKAVREKKNAAAIAYAQKSAKGLKMRKCISKGSIQVQDPIEQAPGIAPAADCTPSPPTTFYIIEAFEHDDYAPVVEETGFQLHRSLSNMSLGLSKDQPDTESKPLQPIDLPDWLSSVSGQYFMQKSRESIDAFGLTRKWVDSSGLKHVTPAIAGDVETEIGRKRELGSRHSFDSFDFRQSNSQESCSLLLNRSISYDTFRPSKSAREVGFKSVVFGGMTEYIEIDNESVAGEIETEVPNDRDQIKRDCGKIIEAICDSFIPLEGEKISGAPLVQDGCDEVKHISNSGTKQVEVIDQVKGKNAASKVAKKRDVKIRSSIFPRPDGNVQEPALIAQETLVPQLKNVSPNIAVKASEFQDDSLIPMKDRRTALMDCIKEISAVIKAYPTISTHQPLKSEEISARIDGASLDCKSGPSVKRNLTSLAKSSAKIKETTGNDKELLHIESMLIDDDAPLKIAVLLANIEACSLNKDDAYNSNDNGNSKIDNCQKTSSTQTSQLKGCLNTLLNVEEPSIKNTNESTDDVSTKIDYSNSNTDKSQRNLESSLIETCHLKDCGNALSSTKEPFKKNTNESTDDVSTKIVTTNSKMVKCQKNHEASSIETSQLNECPNALSNIKEPCKKIINKSTNSVSMKIGNSSSKMEEYEKSREVLPMKTSELKDCHSIKEPSKKNTHESTKNSTNIKSPRLNATLSTSIKQKSSCKMEVILNVKDTNTANNATNTKKLLSIKEASKIKGFTKIPLFIKQDPMPMIVTEMSVFSVCNKETSTNKELPDLPTKEIVLNNEEPPVNITETEINQESSSDVMEPIQEKTQENDQLVVSESVPLPGFKHVENYEDVYTKILSSTNPQDSTVGDGLNHEDSLATQEDEVIVRRIGKTCCDSLCVHCINHNMFDPVENNQREEVNYDVYNSFDHKEQHFLQEEKPLPIKEKPRITKSDAVENKKPLSIMGQFEDITLSGGRLPRQYPTFLTIPGVNTLSNFSNLQLKVASNLSSSSIISEPHKPPLPSCLPNDTETNSSFTDNNPFNNLINNAVTPDSSINENISDSIIQHHVDYMDNLSQKLSENISQFCGEMTYSEESIGNGKCDSNDSFDSLSLTDKEEMKLTNSEIKLRKCNRRRSMHNCILS